MLNLSTPGANGTLLDDRSVRAFQFVAFGVVAVVLCVLGLAGNITSIRVLMTHRMKTSTSIYLIALAVFDILILSCFLIVFSLPVLFPDPLSEVFSSGSASVRYCVYPLSLTAHTATVYITVGFTVERYVAVCFPFKATRWCSRRQARRAVAGIVSFALVYNLPRFFEATPLGDAPAPGNLSAGVGDNYSAPLVLGFHPLYREIYNNYLYVAFMFLFPFLLLIVMNGLLIRAVRRSERGTKSSKDNHRFGKPRRRDTNLTVMLISVVIVFLICQAFPLIDNVLVVILPSERTASPSYVLFYSVSQVLVVFNSAVNFILYCCFGQKFRRAFLVICVCSVVRKRFLDDVNGSTNIGAATHRDTCCTASVRGNRGLLITVSAPGMKQDLGEYSASSKDHMESSEREPILRTTCL